MAEGDVGGGDGDGRGDEGGGHCEGAVCGIWGVVVVEEDGRERVLVAVDLW